MKKGIIWRVGIIAVMVVLAVVFFLPNTPLFKSMPDVWKKNMPNKGIILGLDLQGGLHLVFEVEGDKAVEIDAERIASNLNGVFARKKITASAKNEGLFVTVTPGGMDIRKVIEDTYPGLMLTESSGVLKYKRSEKEKQHIKDTATDQVLEIIRN